MNQLNSSVDRNRRSYVAAAAGLGLSLLVGLLSLLPSAWFVAVLILVVLAMPVFLLAEPLLRKLWHQRRDLVNFQAG